MGSDSGERAAIFPELTCFVVEWPWCILLSVWPNQRLTGCDLH